MSSHYIPFPSLVSYQLSRIGRKASINNCLIRVCSSIRFYILLVSFNLICLLLTLYLLGRLCY